MTQKKLLFMRLHNRLTRFFLLIVLFNITKTNKETMLDKDEFLEIYPNVKKRFRGGLQTKAL